MEDVVTVAARRDERQPRGDKRQRSFKDVARSVPIFGGDAVHTR
jgi:hypothetical protein